MSNDNKQLPVRRIDNNKHIKNSTTLKVDKNIKISVGTLKCTTTIIDNDKSNSMIDIICINKKGINALFNDKFTVNPETYKSESDGSYTDTIYIIKSKNSYINMLSLKKGDYSFNHADIVDNSININYGIRIGMDKERVLKKFNASLNNCDTLVVTTDERTVENIFIFKDNILNRLNISLLAN